MYSCLYNEFNTHYGKSNNFAIFPNLFQPIMAHCSAQWHILVYFLLSIFMLINIEQVYTVKEILVLLFHRIFKKTSTGVFKDPTMC